MRKYKFTTCLEVYTSRVPSLFPYLEEGANGTLVLKSAISSPQGSYGHIMPDFKIPYDVEVDEVIIVDSDRGDVLSYYDMMQIYYQYKDTDSNRDFIEWVDTALGKIDMTNVKIPEDAYLAPQQIYLASVPKMLKEYNALKKIHDFYKEQSSEDKATIYQDMCCTSQKYEDMGGDEIRRLLQENLHKATTLAAEYFNYADVKHTTVDYNLFLVNSVNDLGIFEQYKEEWVGGNEYFKGEIVVFDHDTYVCKETTTGTYDPNTNKINFDVNNWGKATSEDVINTPNQLENGETFYPHGNEVQRQNVIDDLTQTITMESTDTDKYITDSKLQSLRRFKTYLNMYDTEEMPSEGEDWLYYYRKGYITNISILTDELGNIQKEGNNLYAYGDAITDITRDIENNTITFDYIIGAQLTATESRRETDDMGNEFVYYGEFSIDTDSDKGVRYKDVYTYIEESGIGKMKDFDEYITNEDAVGLEKYPFLIYSNSKVVKDTIDFQSTAKIVPITELSTTYTHQAEDYEFNPLTRQDALVGITFQPKINADIHIDRGNNSAYERHLKLGEIKTMEDLENFQNNGFFNIQKS